MGLRQSGLGLADLAFDLAGVEEAPARHKGEEAAVLGDDDFGPRLAEHVTRDRDLLSERIGCRSRERG